MNAPLPYELVEPKVNPRVREVVDVLAERVGSDRDWNDAEYWTRQAIDAGFFADLTPKMRRQIITLVAKHPGTVCHDVFNHLTAIVEDLVEEEE